jgi:hypothetical protein
MSKEQPQCQPDPSGGENKNKPGGFSFHEILSDGNPLIQNDPEVLALDEQLRKIALDPEMIIDPIFKAGLKELLKEMLPEKHQPEQPPPEPTQ